MPPVLVANTAAGSADTFVVTTPAIDTTGANFLALALVGANAGYTVSDSKSNTWISRTVYTSTITVRLLYVANPTVGSGHTFTASSGATAYPSIFVAAFSGVLLVSPYDTENGAIAFGPTTHQPGSITPAASNALILTATAQDNNVTFTINSGFTITDQLNTISNHYIGALAYLAQGTAAAVNPTWTYSAGGGNPATTQASFKSAGGTVVTQTLTGALLSAGMLPRSSGKALVGAL